MANIECKDCGDLVDVEARTVTLPFVCKWCEEGFTYTTPRYIIQYEGCDGWIRSENTDAVLRDLFRKSLDGATTKDVKIKSLENSLDYYKKIYNRLYKDFSELETLYFLERRKTWWERLWS